MKELVFLPDRIGRDALSAATGFVRVGESGDSLQSLTQRLVLPPEKKVQQDDAVWRGMLALALLCDAWPEMEAQLSVLRVEASSSAFAAWVLAAMPPEEQQEALHLVLLKREDRKRLLGIADGRRGLKLPASPADWADFIPARATWYDRETGLWQDPVPFLNEHERAILLARMTMMGLDAPEIERFKAELTDADKPAVEAVRAGDEDALRDLGIRIQAVCACQDFEGFSLRREPCAVAEDNALVRVFSALDVRYTASRECVTYLWQGVPFARSSAALGLTGTNDAAQADALAAIDGELQLAERSVHWNRRCAEGVAQWLAEQDAALLPEARAQAEVIRHVKNEKAGEIRRTITLEWPWDASSGAVRYLLKEALGESWMEGAARPFADNLTKLTAHALGDHLLQHGCACADGVLLPPLSREMAKCIAQAQDGEGLAADMMRFEPREDGGITASFLLRGAGEIRMVRTYPVEEILVLSEAASPTVAVWPCLPMKNWRAYHIFVRGGETAVSALSGNTWRSLDPAAVEEDVAPAWRSLSTDSYPACLCVMQGERCLGVLPNALPACHVEPRGDAQVSIDMGDSATATVITLDGRNVAYTGENLTRMLVAPIEMPADDFLPSLTPAELTPSSVMLKGEGDELFTDGYVYAVTKLDALRELAPGTVSTSLKWRADNRSVRARRILMHQVMLGASLTAMLAGARSIRWRVTVADEMAEEGRDALLNLVDELSVTLAQETGLTLRDGKFTVTWAEEAAALNACLRSAGGMKGTFAVLDVGGGSTKLHLWMQGKNRPLGGAVLLEGASTMLLKTLRDRPEMLYTDFEDCGEEALLAAVGAVCEQLACAGESAAQSDKAQLMLDALLEEHKPAITRQLYARFNGQSPTCMQSILLEMYAAALFCVGLMVEQAGNDTNISHLFPADLTICMTGRGAWLMDTLTPQLRSGLQRIAQEPVHLRHPVRTMTVRPAQLPALGVARGMSVLKDTQRTIDTPVIRTRQSFSELMRGMVIAMQQCFPTHVWTLHPGLFDAWGKLTPAGEDTIRRVASACYGEGEDIPGATMAFVGKLARAAIMQEQVAFPGE